MVKVEQVWHCAVKNTTTDKKEWHYHLFYDFDNMKAKKLDAFDIDWIVKFMRVREMSFMLRHTMHGYHLIGLTPIDASKWGLFFDLLQDKFPTYHDGQAIRITKKMQDEFIIVASNFDYPYALNLAKLFKIKDHYDNQQVKAIKELWYVLLSVLSR